MSAFPRVSSGGVGDALLAGIAIGVALGYLLARNRLGTAAATATERARAAQERAAILERAATERTFATSQRNVRRPTATATLVEAVRGHKARICCTRKTMPGLRALQKYAVRAGGGVNHRFGLDDAVLIKDNHVAAASGVAAAIRAARAGVGHLVKIEVEIDRLDQLDEALAEKADAVLLDNMSPEKLSEAVRRIAGRAVAEASGRITPATAPAIAASGVDLISAGWLTHSAQVLDIGLDWRRASAGAELSAA